MNNNSDLFTLAYYVFLMPWAYWITLDNGQFQQSILGDTNAF